MTAEEIFREIDGDKSGWVEFGELHVFLERLAEGRF